MSKSPLDDVASHWSQLVENFSTSADKFYVDVEVAIRRRQVPQVRTKRVLYDQGGVLSPRREYFRIEGERHYVDLCAAPFGSGFFFSSWTVKKKPSFVVLHWLAMVLTGLILWTIGGLLVSAVWRGPGLPNALLQVVFNYTVTLPLVTIVILWGVALLARVGVDGPDASTRLIPLVGTFYERVFAPATFYRLDTLQMFQTTVHAAMLETIDGLLASKGLRALSEQERKPIFGEPSVARIGVRSNVNLRKRCQSVLLVSVLLGDGRER